MVRTMRCRKDRMDSCGCLAEVRAMILSDDPGYDFDMWEAELAALRYEDEELEDEDDFGTA